MNQLEIFFSPEVMHQSFQILNVVDSKEKAVGNVAFMFDEKKIYVYGIVEEEGVTENFRSIVQPYIKGIASAHPELEVYSCLYVGCKKISINTEEDDKKDKQKQQE
ncbi:hypothetical protein OEV82_05720 [Caldibacillus thermolactis]|uniref:Uncharacterized protein n=1 Tax=Pallidibacillus thermolactis TaxID=251051 RepID=A0ABT2WE33_9BACI|nr:hypothetical protein [Pallidibacillus thermolactis]MCU9593949.1 hypothetical protein [Pallidibacillus thermolactis]MCU9600813.1 hypothetical protein [Pallidibacillus thermolactis subsp. kokeshiiformis]MED1673536.1 hypothetical protein [Pallidibacillus thermolactis subsp. kokeshiiformis]